MGTYKKHIAENRTVADCVGLIKSFFWTENGTIASKHANGCPDKSANGLFKLCKKTGPISSIPKTPGLVVWRSGHIGISLDGEYAIEARGFNYGVVKTRIRNRGWASWGMLPGSLIDYVEAGASPAPSMPDPPPAGGCPYEEPSKYQRKGSAGAGTKWVQWMLSKCGYSVGRHGVDGAFGKDTLAAVTRFQRDHSLEVDGIVGPLTRAALKQVYENKNGG